MYNILREKSVVESLLGAVPEVRASMCQQGILLSFYSVPTIWIRAEV